MIRRVLYPPWSLRKRLGEGVAFPGRLVILLCLESLLVDAGVGGASALK